jgi:hypothetical protein
MIQIVLPNNKLDAEDVTRITHQQSSTIGDTIIIHDVRDDGTPSPITADQEPAIRAALIAATPSLDTRTEKVYATLVEAAKSVNGVSITSATLAQLRVVLALLLAEKHWLTVDAKILIR